MVVVVCFAWLTLSKAEDFAAKVRKMRAQDEDDDADDDDWK
jgi:hypothetical protein